MKTATSETSWNAWFDRENPPRLDQANRAGTLSLQAIRASVGKHPGRFEGRRGKVALGLLHLWHDHWEEAHQIAQANEGDPDHDFLHAIVHRREQDFSNAAYWFREAGKNPAFGLLASRASKLLMENTLAATLLPEGAWSSSGFLQAVRKRQNENLLRALQAEEMIAFFETLTP